MTVSMFKASAPIFVQFLTSLSAVLDKAAAHAEAKKIDQSVLLNTRLYPDMFPLVRQVRAATDHAISACGRLAGVELLTFPNTESSIPELKDRIAKTVEFIKSIKPAQIDGTEDKEITIKFASGERKFTGQSLLLNFCLPNFYFHATTASCSACDATYEHSVQKTHDVRLTSENIHTGIALTHSIEAISA